MKKQSFDLESLDLDRVGQWPGWLRACILLIFFLITGYIGYCFWIEETYLAWEATKKLCERLQEEIAHTHQELGNVEIFKARSDKVHMILELLQRQLPEKNEEAKRLEEIAELALQSRLQIRSVKPEPAVQKGSYQEHPVFLTMVGDFHGLGEWISRLSSTMPLLSVQDCSLFLNKVSETLDIQLRLKTYSSNASNIEQAGLHDPCILESNASTNANAKLNSNSNQNVESKSESESESESDFAFDSVPEPKQWDAYPYTAGHLRSPFQRANLHAIDKPAIEYQTEENNSQERTKELLELYSLDSLRVVGIIQTKALIWGLVRDNAGNIHRVKVGDYLGQNEGKIENITQSGIEILETVFKDSMTPEERKIHLPLFSETKEGI